MYRLPYPAALPRPIPLRRPSSLVVWVAALVWLGGLAGLRPLALPDEGRYVGVAWEMFRSGDWITPTLGGLPFFHKPPLFYWITAAAMHLFGPGVWAARTASIVAGSITVTLLHATLRDWLGERPARMAAWVLATQPLFFGGAQFANMDMLVAGCISAAVLFGARAALRFEAGEPRRRELIGLYLSAALGVLAKGLIGIALPMLVLLVWLGVVGHWRTARSLLWMPGFALFTVIVAPWFMAVQWSHPKFFHYFFVVQHFQRFAGSGFNNVQPVWFYAPVLLLSTLPWSGWWFANLRRHPVARAARPAVLSLVCVWFGVVLAFFSIPASKLVGYVLPTLAPIAVLVALTAEPLMARSARARLLWKACAIGAAVLCIGVAIGVTMARPKSSLSLARALLAQPDAHAGLAYIDEYPYDLHFYLGDSSPRRVVSNWDPVEVSQHDNWRKELADAGSFAPAAAADRLIDADTLRADICRGRIHWVVGGVDSPTRLPYLKAAELIASDHGNALWKVDAATPPLAKALGCPDGRSAAPGK